MNLIPKWVLWGATAGLVSLGILAAGPGISLAGSSHRFSMAVDPAITVSNINGQNITPANGDFSGTLKADALQTHTGGATTLLIGTTGTGAVSVGNATGGVSAAGPISTNGNQFLCTAASQCVLMSASGQGVSVDTGGGTATVVVGGSTATTTTIGRLGQTTNLNGNATFNTAGPNLGGTSTGSWNAMIVGLATATTNYGAFRMAGDVTNVKFRQVSCTHRVAGTGANGTLAVRNVTDGTTLCSGSYTCTTAANTPTAIFDCNQAPLASKMYAVQFSTGCGGTQVTDLNCTVEITH